MRCEHWRAPLRRAASRWTFSTARRRLSRSRPTPDDIAVGRIAGCFGLRGELKCDPTRAARSLFVAGSSFVYRNGDRSGAIRIEGVREHSGRLLLTIQGIGDRTHAQTFAGATLYAPRDAVSLDAGEYLDADLIGCDVIGVDGQTYGPVERVEHFPASDMLVVGGAMVPMVDAIVRDIDTAAKTITIDPPAGLLGP